MSQPPASQAPLEVPRRTSRVSSSSFDYSLDFKKINFRERPELYRIGRGEQGVLLVEPYKSEILPHWRFADVEKATHSSAAIYQLFLDYLAQHDFVGADMARKFLQMGYTRARRYANHKGGKKYKGAVPEDKKGLSGAHGRDELPRSPEDPIKAQAAAIFKQKWDAAKQHPDYLVQKQQFLQWLKNTAQN
ncbi:DUF4385 domain-containing protein [Acinetobacter sp. B51(2017)]|uniref:DUF4385 domain-containing protein n=1 Tax=Acinetobacter sp. B51(2017) TaxID=2060938 RepID=UPI000F0969A6|nr:DUF4385 domain-containing protein [Acinetobacter sp. B51(2017)]